jgi:hypothetical protein
MVDANTKRFTRIMAAAYQEPLMQLCAGIDGVNSQHRDQRKPYSLSISRW